MKKLIKPFSINSKDQKADYFGHRLWLRFLYVAGVGLQKMAEDHAQTIAEANIKAGKEISEQLKQGFQSVQKSQQHIHHALLHQTDVIQEGMYSIDLSIQEGFDKTVEGVNEIANRVDHLGLTVVESSDKLFQGLAGLKATVDMGMMNLLSQFELQRTEIQQGFEMLADILENNRKTEARERYRDGKEAYEQYLQHQDEPQFLQDAHDYLQKSVEIYRGNPFCHLYLGHIFQEPSVLFDPAKAQEHYQLSATYAKGIPNDSLTALGYFMAAWMAYINGDLQKAVDLGQQSLKYDEAGIPENYYNLAKYFACLSMAEESLKYLDQAVQQFDPYYTVKADMDEDFKHIREELEAYFIRIRDKEAKELNQKLGGFGLPAADSEDDPSLLKD